MNSRFHFSFIITIHCIFEISIMRFQDVYIIMKFEKCTDVRLKLVLSSQKTYSFDIFLLDNDAKDVVLSQQYHHFFVRPLRIKSFVFLYFLSSLSLPLQW